MSLKYWWNDTDKGKPNYVDKNQSHCHFAHHRSHLDHSGVESGLPWGEPGYNSQSQGTALPQC